MVLWYAGNNVTHQETLLVCNMTGRSGPPLTAMAKRKPASVVPSGGELG